MFVFAHLGCFDTFEQFVDLKGQNGNLIVGVNTVDGCKDICVRTAGCYGFDYRKGSSPLCLTYSTDFVNTLTYTNGFDAYIRARCIIPSVITPGKLI